MAVIGRPANPPLAVLLTGDGVVLPASEAAEVEALANQLEREMKPNGAMGQILLRRIATMSNRLDRCTRHDATMTAKRVREAVQDCDLALRTEAEVIGAGIAANPAFTVQRLKQMPEGIDRLIRAWMAVRGELVASGQYAWQFPRVPPGRRSRRGRSRSHA